LGTSGIAFQRQWVTFEVLRMTPPGIKPTSFRLESYGPRRGEISLHMSHFFAGYLKEIYHHFEGDLALVIVLAEIAHHSTVAWVDHRSSSPVTPPEDDAARSRMPSCSAFSLAAATGLPRETIRRKIARLLELGWVEKTGRADVRITPKVAEHFTPDFNIRILDQLLQTADRIRGVLSSS
jgi:hypothetical protein